MLLVYEILYIHEHRSALPAAVQTLSSNAFEVTNALLRKCQEYYKVGELVVDLHQTVLLLRVFHPAICFLWQTTKVNQTTKVSGTK